MHDRPSRIADTSGPASTGALDDLGDRLTFLGLGEADRRRLRACAEEVMQAMGPALDGFYDRVRATPEMRGMFPGEGAMTSAQARQSGHWQRIAAAEFGADYVAAVRRVGDIHARIGLEPRWYIGGYGAVLDGVLTELVARRLAGRSLLPWQGRRVAEALGADISVIVRAALLDMDLSISVYLDNLEASRRAAEATQKAAEAAAADSSSTVAAQARLIEAVRNVAEGVRHGSGEIAQASDDLARRTEQQAASLEETAAALEDMARTVRAAAEHAGTTGERVRAARADAEAGSGVVGEAKAAMDQIARSSQEVGQIIGVIDEIAFQTNLLALNAGVEAARAGEAGRGFAVVATEVRQLAQRSAEAARNIKQLIERSDAHVGEGVRLVDATTEALHRVTGAIGEISSLAEEIAATTRAQTDSITQINGAMVHLDRMTQQNAAMVEQSHAATVSLDRQARELRDLVADAGSGPAFAAAPDTASLRRIA